MPCFAQPNPDTLWTRSFGSAGTDIGNSVCLSADGNYVVAGYTQALGADKIYIVKLNTSGDTLWTRIIDTGNIEQANAICRTTDGGFALAGSVFLLESGSQAMLLVKTNSNGDTLWTRAYGWGGADLAYAVQQTPDGGYILAGSTRIETTQDDLYLVKTNSAGDTLWTRTVGTTARNELALSVQRTVDGGYVAVGYSYDQQTATVGYGVKTDAAGNLQWSQVYSDIYYKSCASVVQASDGGYLITGTSVPSGTLHLGPYLMKTDSAGLALWTHLYSVNPLDEWVNSSTQTSDGGFILVGAIGNIDSAVFGIELIRMDQTGGVEWSREYAAGTNAQGASVLETADHGYVATGATQPGGDANIYVVRTGPEDLNLVYPNGGEFLPISQPVSILWNGAIHGGNVALEFNRSYPSPGWETISASAPNNGHFSWSATGPESDHVRFRVRHLTNAALSDTSDADLSLRVPRLHLSWPNGGETVLSGVRVTVQFERVVVPDVLRLLLNRDYPNGAWQQVATGIFADSTAFWNVQLPAGDHCRLRLVSMTDSTLADTSDADFVLRAPQMTLSAPNGGEHLPAGVPFTITWAAPEHQGSIRITLNRDYPSGTWQTVAANTANDGSYAWTPDAPVSDHCRIRIATMLDPQTYVESAADFSITASFAAEHDALPDVYALNMPYPNPFNSQTTLSFAVPAPGRVSLAVYDLAGRRVQTIAGGVFERGVYRIPFDASALPSGVYFVKMDAGKFAAAQKMVLLK